MFLQKNKWIRVKDMPSKFEEQRYMLKDGLFLSLNSIFLPSSAKFIAFDSDHIFFVTYNEHFSVKYIKYWRDSLYHNNLTLIQRAEINFRAKKWQELKLKRKIIAIEAINGNFYALTAGESVHDRYIIIYKWSIFNDGISDEYTEYILKGVDSSLCKKSTKLTVCDTKGAFKKNTHLMLYGLSTNLVYYGKIRDEERKIDMLEVDKLSLLSHNPRILLCPINKISDDKEYIDYLGMTFNSNNKGTKPELFVYKHSLVAKLDSKLNRDRGLIFSDGNDLSLISDATNICKFNPTLNSDVKPIVPNNRYLIASKNPSAIYLVNDIGEIDCNMICL
jgi:hypothetical protein